MEKDLQELIAKWLRQGNDIDLIRAVLMDQIDVINLAEPLIKAKEEASLAP
jgi:hypothetical protein